MNRNDYLPCFGYTDMIIIEDCNIVSESYSQVGNWYDSPENVLQFSMMSKEYMCGEHYFFVEEIEIFKIIY